MDNKELKNIDFIAFIEKLQFIIISELIYKINYTKVLTFKGKAGGMFWH